MLIIPNLNVYSFLTCKLRSKITATSDMTYVKGGWKPNELEGLLSEPRLLLTLIRL